MNLPPLPNRVIAYDTFHQQVDAYSAEQMKDYARQAVREAVATYKAELLQKYEASTGRATEAEGDAFTHGYLCGESEAVAAAVPDGWKLVPIEPTEEMLNATYAGQHCSDIWRDMIAAAPGGER